MDTPRIACVYPPGFMRGAMAVGAARCLLDHNLRPQIIAGCSSGALAASTVVGWDREEMDKAKNNWSTLTPGKISEMRLADEILLGSVVATSLLHLAPNIAKSGKLKTIENGARALISLGAQALSLEAFLKQSSLFSNAPLARLLEKELSFEKIFASPVKMIATAAKYENGDRSIFTNFLPGDQNKERLVRGLLASATVVPSFPPIMIDGEYYIDGVFARQDFLAIDLIEQHAECDYILFFVFYWLPADRDVDGFMAISDRAHELMVEYRIRTILDQLPQATRSKVILVELEKPPLKTDLRKFSSAEPPKWIAAGYEATEKMLVTRGWKK